MKNVHILPTDKPSRFYNTNTGEYHFREYYVPDTIQTCKNHNIYITSDEEIKRGDWFFDIISNTVHKAEFATGVFNSRKKIILTTDQDLFNEGIQPIDDEFFKWFTKNPNYEEVEIENGWGLNIDIETPYYKIVIPKEEETTLDTYKFLEENGVFIHYRPEHYGDGSNLNFSIQFTKQKTQTGWYNDNHEFGDVYETMNKSIQLAKWYLDNPNYIDLINSGYGNPEYIKYKDVLSDFLSTITEWGEFNTEDLNFN